MTKHPVEPEELQAFLDKELEPDRQAFVDRHIQECQECAAMIADLQTVSSKLHAWQVEPAPANLKPPVITAEKRPRYWTWPRVAAGLGISFAGILLIAAVGIPNLLRSRMAADRATQTGRQRMNAGSDTLNLKRPRPVPALMSSADAELPQGRMVPIPGVLPAGRLVAYQVTLWIEVKEFDPAKEKLLRLVEQAGGYVAQANTAETPSRPRSATLTVRVPADKLSTVLNQFRGLGRVRQDQLSTEEVTEQVIDLEARLKNARTTEQRLIAVLTDRTGKVKDILEVEREIARTREQIERMEAQRQNLMRRVEMATVNITLSEEFKAQLEPTPIGTGTRLWNALVDGYQGFVETLLGITLFFARYGLSLTFWLGLAWLAWRLARSRVKRFLSQTGFAA